MPRKGWKKPPGYAGYARATPNRRTRSAQERSAGPRMLPFDLTTHDETPSELQHVSAENVGGEDHAPHADDERAIVTVEDIDNDNDGLVSSRLRARAILAGVQQASVGEGDTEGDSEPEATQARDDADDSDDTDDNSLFVRPPKKLTKPSARVVQEDDDASIAPPNTANPTPSPNARFTVNTSLPLLMLSVTLSKQKGHVLPAWLALVFAWMQLRCVAGAAALERGGKNQNLHVQIMLHMHICEQDIDALKLELKSLVGWRRGDGSGTYCAAKEFGAGQTWAMMLGYLHKDQHQPHFNVKLHNIDPTDIVKGIAEWQTAKLSYEDGKIMISRANVFHRLATHRANASPDTNNSFLDDMTDLLNTQKYMVSSLLVTQSGSMRLASAEALWKLVKGIEPMSTNDTKDLFFPFTAYTRPGAPEAGQRFFDAYPEQQATLR